MGSIIKLEFGDELEFKHPVCSDCKGNTFNVEISENDDIILHCISCQNVIDFQIKSLTSELATYLQVNKDFAKRVLDAEAENDTLRERLTRCTQDNFELCQDAAILAERLARLVEEMEFARVCILGCEGEQALTDRMAQAIAVAESGKEVIST